MKVIVGLPLTDLNILKLIKQEEVYYISFKAGHNHFNEDEIDIWTGEQVVQNKEIIKYVFLETELTKLPETEKLETVKVSQKPYVFWMRTWLKVEMKSDVKPY